jgi:succinate dehydrogenase/fumarate reductase cytochrome b subunit
MDAKLSNQSILTWFLQRITGLFLGFFLITHINVHHLFHDIATHGIINFESVRQNLDSSVLWKIYYFLFVPMVVYHALNGIWQIIADFRPSGSASILIKALLWVLGIVLVVIGAMTLNNLF